MEVIGRRRELTAVRSALEAGTHVLLEGPPGTGKSTLLDMVTRQRSQALHVVEGSAHLTPPRLIGHHLPSAVVARGYHAEDFVHGPLPQAMRSGGVLLVEEFNRVPSDTLDVLLTPMTEGHLDIPRMGRVHAEDGFRVVAAMNPFDNIGTHPLGRSLRDRMVRLAVDYQDEAEERCIVATRRPGTPGWLVDAAVALTRSTRTHEDLRSGSSVRGAIDLCAVAVDLADLRGVAIECGDEHASQVVLEAALLTLSGRVRVEESSSCTAEQVITELWEDLFILTPARANGDRSIDIDSVVEMVGRPTPRHRRRPSPRPAAPRLLPPGTPAEPPKVLARGGGVGGGPAAPRDADRRRGAPDPTALPEVGTDDVATAFEDDPERAVDSLGDLWARGDEEVRALIRRLAVRIVLAVAQPTRQAAVGRGPLRSQRYRFQSDDLDLDRTLEDIAGKPHPEHDDIWVMGRGRNRRTVVLMLDISGSMKGGALLMAATAAAAVASALADDDFAIVAFWRDATVLKALREERCLDEVIGDLLAVQARGLTNISHGMDVGLDELADTVGPDRVGLLLTDGVHNVGGDPLEVAARWPQLHVLATSTAPARVQACEELAEAGRGRCIVVQTPGDIPVAVSTCMSALR